MVFFLKNMRPYIVPFIATVVMIIFAFLYEHKIPMWWFVAFIMILGGYTYAYNKSL